MTATQDQRIDTGYRVHAYIYSCHRCGIEYIFRTPPFARPTARDADHWMRHARRWRTLDGYWHCASCCAALGKIARFQKEPGSKSEIDPDTGMPKNLESGLRNFRRKIVRIQRQAWRDALEDHKANKRSHDTPS